MSLLINQFRDIIGKDSTLGEESKWMPSFPSGIDVMDYRNGKYEDGEIASGIDGGKILMLVGKSGTGKSTLGLQIGISVADLYEQSQLIHLDFERATNETRVLALSGWTKEHLKNKYIHMNSGISTESVYKLIKALSKLKKENRAALEFDTGKVGDNGKPIMALPPTVVLLDSLAVMAPNDIDDSEEMKGQMSATAIAKANTNLFKRIMSPLIDANIILIVINHINQKVDINPMAKTQAQVNFLKQDETLPGGVAPIYLSNYLIKLVSSDKFVPEKEFGIKGFKVIGELVKSRSAAAGMKFTMVFDQQNGFDNILSNYLLLKDNKIIQGAGRGYYLPNLKDVKFSQKDFREKYLSNPALKEAFDALVQEQLEAFVPVVGMVEEYQLDEESGLYYNTANGGWYELNEESGEYTEVEVEEVQD